MKYLKKNIGGSFLLCFCIFLGTVITFFVSDTIRTKLYQST